MHSGEAIILQIGGMNEDDMAMMGVEDESSRMLEYANSLLCKANEIYEMLPPEIRRKMDKHIKAKEEQRMKMNRAVNTKIVE